MPEINLELKLVENVPTETPEELVNYIWTEASKIMRYEGYHPHVIVSLEQRRKKKKLYAAIVSEYNKEAGAYEAMMRSLAKDEKVLAVGILYPALIVVMNSTQQTDSVCNSIDIKSLVFKMTWRNYNRFEKVGALRFNREGKVTQIIEDPQLIQMVQDGLSFNPFEEESNVPNLQEFSEKWHEC